KARERIVVSEIVQLLFFFDVIERKRDVPGQLEQQLHLLLVEESDLARVEREHAYALVSDDERQEGQRIDAALPALLLHLGAGIVLYVVRDHGLLLLDGASRHSPSYRAALAHREGSRGEELLRIAAQGDRL